MRYREHHGTRKNEARLTVSSRIHLITSDPRNLQATLALALLWALLCFSRVNGFAAWVVETLAGGPPYYGSVDGVGTLATFFAPAGIALVDSGALVVSVARFRRSTRLHLPLHEACAHLIFLQTDLAGNVIRRIDLSSGAVSTVAGVVGMSGFSDGAGTAATFLLPWGISAAWDASPAPFAVIVRARKGVGARMRCELHTL
jgi:hypothetical protein